MFSATALVFFGDSLSDNGNLFALAGIPKPPYVNGIFSNGPTYTAPENLPSLLNLSATNFAFGGAEAVGRQTVKGTNINLGGQVAQYLATRPVAGTAAFINIGSNDYLNYDPKIDGPQASFVAKVVGSIAHEVDVLAAAGIDNIVLYTLGSPGLAPIKAGLTPIEIAGANAIIAAHNQGIQQLAAAENAQGVHTTIVDLGRLQLETVNDADTFGFKTTDTPFVSPVNGVEVPTGIDHILRSDQIAFFDEIHPSAAGHGVIAAFSAATLNADHVLLFDAGAQDVHGSEYADLIFTGGGNDSVSAGAGNDVVFAGGGNDIVCGGAGNDLIAGGSGNDNLSGGEGSDLLAGNLGNDWLAGGGGADVLISGQGTDLVFGGDGNDLLIFHQDVLQPKALDTFDGGSGIDTVRVIVDAMAYAIGPVHGDLLAFGASVKATHGGVASSIGLTATKVERVEIFVQLHDGSITPAETFGPAAVPESPTVASLLHNADLWGLL